MGCCLQIVFKKAVQTNYLSGLFTENCLTKTLQASDFHSIDIGLPFFIALVDECSRLFDAADVAISEDQFGKFL